MIGQDLISYCRVSTSRQGRSGLGLEGQQQAIARFAEAEGCIIRQELIEHIARWVFRCTVVIFHVAEQQVTEVALAEHTTTWSRHSRRIEPISLSAHPFCQGERGDVGRSRMPIDRILRIKTSP